MKKINAVFLLILMSISFLHAQEEFLGKDGGLSVSAEANVLSGELEPVGSRYSIMASDVFLVSFSKFDVEGVGVSMFSLGLISRVKDQNTFSRAYLGVTPTFIDDKTLWGLTLSGIICANTQKSCPTSFALSYSTLKDFEDDLNAPNSALGFSVSQAFGAKNMLYPIICAGVSKSLNYSAANSIVLSLSAGLNLSF